MPITSDRLTTQRFDPQANCFTFPNYWTLDQVTCDEVSRKMEAVMDDVFAFLAPIPGIAPLPQSSGARI